MARLIDHDIAPVLDAAATWRDRCLLGQGSVFSDAKLWTPPHVAELVKHYLGNLIEGGGATFLQKLQRQLSPVSPGAKQLVAEMYWVMLLFLSNVRANSKRRDIAEIWSWSGSTLAADHPLLAGPLDDRVAIGSAGPGYNTYRWAELAFFVELMRKWLEQTDAAHRELLSDPWRFAQFVDRADTKGTRQLRHILLFLLLPDNFERIASGREKRAALKAFANEVKEEDLDSLLSPEDSDRLVVDKKLCLVRRALAKTHPDTLLDFYLAPLRERWAPESPPAEPSPAATRRVWVEKTIVRGRPDRESGPHALGHALWSPQRSRDGRDIYSVMRQVRADDIVFHLTDNAALTGVSLAAAIADETFVGLPNTEWANRPAYLVPLTGHIPLDPALPREDFLGSPHLGPALQDIVRNSDVSLFYNDQLELNQGAYLTVAPLPLVRVLNQAYRQKTGRDLPYLPEVLGGTVALEAIPSTELPEQAPADYLVDLFIPQAEAEELLHNLREHKNLIIQGPPGVGKTFVARRLAHAMMNTQDPRRLAMVQFHQSYSYEDFVQGYRPGDGGQFRLKNGHFYEFCRRAAENRPKPYVFIIDEINRGNLSKILGELMMLIEPDKRGETFAIPLAYSQSDADMFFVPENVYVVGLMNTADRSLALVDYALRRRFVFADLEPAFDQEAFVAFLDRHGASEDLIRYIQSSMAQLNIEISDDRDLGPGFRIGHSYFCPREPTSTVTGPWVRTVIRTQIGPLLREYWFDKPRVDVDARIAVLLAGVPD